MAMIQSGAVQTASDYGTSDLYGSSVAISANGLVMAVGAIDWDGTHSGQGGVYVYDRVSGAWVQRGAVLTEPSPGSTRYFGSAVALNADGSVLAVGAKNSLLYGRAYVFDWSGGAWTQRGGTAIVASDFENGDAFGSGIAIDGGGDLLVVGAPVWQGTYVDQGVCYTFDWSGTAWVERAQKLTVAFSISDGFGRSAALNAAGTILAVGCYIYDYASVNNAGGVYIHDLSGVTWVQRGALLVASDYTANDNFGTSVALDSAGTLLAVGAPLREGTTGTDRGAVYLYEWSGSAWAETEIIEPADAADSDLFGASVSMDATAQQLIIGAPQWEGALLNVGGVYLFTPPLIGVEADITTSITVRVGALADITTGLTVRVGLRADITAGLTITVAQISDITTRLAINITTIADIAAGLTINVYDPDLFSEVATINNQGRLWQCRLLLAGADVSTSLVGSVQVDAEADASRIARFSLRLAVPFNPTQWQDAGVIVEYLVAGSVWRLFSGRITATQIELVAGIAHFTAADARNVAIALASAEQLAGLTPGAYHSPLLFGAGADGNAYLRQRMASLPADLDLSPLGTLRTASWFESAAQKTFLPADIMADSISIDVAESPADSMASGLAATPAKKIKLVVEVRSQRLRSARMLVSWGAGGLAPDKLPFLPYPEVIVEALDSLSEGWLAERVVLTAAAPEWVGARQKANAMSARLVRRWVQDISRTYTYILREPGASDATPYSDELRVSVQSAFDETAWVERGEIIQTTEPGADLVAEANASIAAAINAARKQILADRRANSARFDVPLDPTLDLPYCYALSTPRLAAAGRARRINHVMDFDAGTATTGVTLALFGAPGGGAAAAGDAAQIVPTINVTTDTAPEITLPPPLMPTQIIITPPAATAPDWDAAGWSAEIHKVTTATQGDALTEMDIDYGRVRDITGKVLSYSVSVAHSYDVARSQFMITVPAIDALYTAAEATQYEEVFDLDLPASSFTITL